MTTLTYQDNILIAETLEKLQDLNSELYGDWYTKLYHAVGHEENWNVNTLHILELLLLDNTRIINTSGSTDALVPVVQLSITSPKAPLDVL